MAIKTHKEICQHDNVHFVINDDCSGDYWNGTLQWYCPECGQMKPLLSIELELSNREKKKLADEFAREYNLPFKECEKQAKEISSDDKYSFLEILRTRTLNSVRRAHSHPLRWQLR